jgi:hypothetical protein
MKMTHNTTSLDQLVDSLGKCLTPESARRVLTLKADLKTQTRVDYLAKRSSKGLLTPEERAEYGDCVKFSSFVAILKSKARLLLAESNGG